MTRTLDGSLSIRSCDGTPPSPEPARGSNPILDDEAFFSGVHERVEARCVPRSQREDQRRREGPANRFRNGSGPDVREVERETDGEASSAQGLKAASGGTSRRRSARQLNEHRQGWISTHERCVDLENPRSTYPCAKDGQTSRRNGRGLARRDSARSAGGGAGHARRCRGSRRVASPRSRSRAARHGPRGRSPSRSSWRPAFARAGVRRLERRVQVPSA